MRLEHKRCLSHAKKHKVSGCRNPHSIAKGSILSEVSNRILLHVGKYPLSRPCRFISRVEDLSAIRENTSGSIAFRTSQPISLLPRLHETSMVSAASHDTTREPALSRRSIWDPDHQPTSSLLITLRSFTSKHVCSGYDNDLQ